MPVRKGSVLGLDVGSGSCGFALLEGNKIIHCGVRLFDTASLNHKNESKQRHRRTARSIRVRLRRHRQRRAATRRLLIDHGLPDPVGSGNTIDPYRCRADGLDRRLTPAEWSAALYLIAKRRGFLPDVNAPQDDEPATGALSFSAQLQANAAMAAGFRSVGEMLFRHPRYTERKRNRAGSYLAVLPAALLREEVQVLFECQRRAGNSAAGEALEAAFAELAFATKGQGDGEARVGWCPFLPDHRRGARHAPSVERYLYLDALTKLRIIDGQDIRRLNLDELTKADARFGKSNGVCFADLRKWFGWADHVRPVHEMPDDADLVTPVGAAAGTVVLRKVMGAGRFAALAVAPGLADAVAAVMTFRNTDESWRQGLFELGLGADLAEVLVRAGRSGSLAVLRGAGPLSAAAAAAMVPYLARGDLFYDAAIAANLDPLAKERAILKTVQNPCVVRSVMQALRQVQAILLDRGYRPARIHVEVADDLSASGARRAQIAIKRGAVLKLREGARVALAGLMPVAQINNAAVERYLLWQEQEGCCVYSGKAMSVRDLMNRAAVQVDHVLPQARSGDNSRHNRVVCFANLNQDKGERTPFEWRGSDAGWWQAFAERVAASRLSQRKKRHLLLQHFAESEARVLRRNLNDTRYSARVLMTALQAIYPDGQHQRHLFARPGLATAALRNAWGLAKNRDDPRHHALDAVVVAAAGNKAMAGLTGGLAQPSDAADGGLPQPWPGFEADVATALEAVLPSRVERRRGRGQAHAVTVRRVRAAPNGEMRVYERRPVWKLRLADLERIPDPEMNGPLIQSLRTWIEAGQPSDRLPCTPSGTSIRRVRLLVTGSTGIPREGLAVNGGIAAFGDIARMDIYYGNGHYVAVPVNRSEIATLPAPPRRAMVPGALRRDWLELDIDYAFCFSLYRGSYIEVQNRRGVVKSGFIRSFDTYKCQFYLTSPGSTSDLVKVGVKTARVLRKFAIDRLGRPHQVRGEALTWQGRTVAVCRYIEPAQEKTSLREVA